MVENNHFSYFSDSDCDGAEGSSVRTKHSVRYFPQQMPLTLLEECLLSLLQITGNFPDRNCLLPMTRNLSPHRRRGAAGGAQTCSLRPARGKDLLNMLQAENRVMHTAHSWERKNSAHISNVIPALGSHGPSKRSCEKNRERLAHRTRREGNSGTNTS